MNITLDQTGKVLELLVQIVVVVVPIVLSWFVRTYIKPANQEKTLGIITRLANSAIDYAEDLDQRGDLDKVVKMLNLPPETALGMSTGIQKLHIASGWLTSELKKLGIDASNEEAQKWVASEFQKRVGSITAVRPALEITKDVASLIDELMQKGLIVLPGNLSQANELAIFLSNWIVTRLGEADPNRQELQRQQAAVILRPKLEEAALMSVDMSDTQIERRLRDLTSSAVTYVQSLKTSHQLTLPERDIATAWLLTEATKMNLHVTSEQLARAVNQAYPA